MSTRAARWLALAFLVGFATAGCSLSPVELKGKACPCATGLVCDPMTQRCVEASPALDGGFDMPASCAAPAVYDATPYAGAGFVCRLANGVGSDAVSVGLDRPVLLGPLIAFDGREVNGCVGFDLGGARQVASVQIRIAATGDACGSSPCATSPSDCGSGDTAAVYFGATKANYRLAGGLNITSSLTDYTVPIAQTAGFIVVCRDAWGDSRDDVLVDALSATCS